jgi:hypothetical protein
MNNGQAETWKVTLPPPHLWGGANVAKDLFKAGESMTVEAHPSKTSSTPRSKPELFYSACPSQLANNLQSGYPRVIMLSGGRQVRISEEQPATVSVRFF